MKQLSKIFSFISLLLLCSSAFAQSKVQRVEKPTGDGKTNSRPTDTPKTEEQKKLEEEIKNAIVDNEVLTVNTNIVNLEAVVFNKKSGQIVTGLKQGNFHVYEDGVKQEISNFATPEAPITVSLVLEYSKWSEVFGYYGSSGTESGKMEVVRPVAHFLSRFIKPPNDYASVIAYDMRPTTITDFTNDPNRLQQTINLLLRNSPAFRENNLYDAVKFALVGGKGDSVVLENSKEKSTEFSGMVDVKSQHKALILVCSGIDTFSKTNYDEVRKNIQKAGIPIYIISTGNLFFKRYEHLLPATDGINGMPGRLTFLQAKNAMNTFAKESGGMHFEMTFESEIPGYLQSINALLRNQYSLAYDIKEKRQPGKRYKLEVRVDVDGDGKTDEKMFEIRHRPFYVVPGEPEKKKK